MIVMKDPTKNDSVLTVADIRKMADQLRAAGPSCPKCHHKAHRAFACGMKNPALSPEGDRVIGQRTCDCNVNFQLNPVTQFNFSEEK